ncbi:MAG: flagellar basal body P-ring protein FlgI [Dongiaceae bacterium]
MLTGGIILPRLRRAALASLIVGLLTSLSLPVSAEDGAPPNAAADPGTRLLVGVGLVVGLSGTGDSVVDQKAVETSIVGVLKRAGLEPWREQIGPGRVAVVMLSAALPEIPRDGARIDVSVSAIGDARSIAGGTLLVAPLRDADGVVHATGQGPVVLDASSAGTVQGVGTAVDLRVAEIANGAVIERQRTTHDYAQLTRTALD